MTEEERQRQIEFILDTLARLTATTSQLAESNAVDRARRVRLEESFVMLLELAGRHEERLDRNDRRAARLEESIAELRRLTERNGDG
ncbi:MAG: hypothetical protein QOD32_1472 [Pyrinomonadaceae bacterium]|jgi:thiamine biosynthesis lipoprotein ApbE|nr:hypothetical protein [Pyrinomonadaceae bacterium]